MDLDYRFSEMEKRVAEMQGRLANMESRLHHGGGGAGVDGIRQFQDTLDRIAAHVGAGPQVGAGAPSQLSAPSSCVDVTETVLKQPRQAAPSPEGRSAGTSSPYILQSRFRGM